MLHKDPELYPDGDTVEVLGPCSGRKPKEEAIMGTCH